ncbi:MAG: T9SS type A sorting domain-containing protein [candidate division WOR-3 bacterium]
MKNIIWVVTILATLLFALETDDKIIFVPNGWTAEKAALAQKWKDMSGSDKQTIILNLEDRLNNLLPQLPPDVFSAEENAYVGYRIRLQKLWQEFKSQPTDWNYAELVYLMNEAENFLQYITREKNLPKIHYEETQIHPVKFDYSKRDDDNQGTGWSLGLVDLSVLDHVTPSVATFNNYIFVAASNQTSGTGEDTIFLWRSTDCGNNWERWHSHGSATADRHVFDVAIDPINQYLYESYAISSSSMSGNIWIRRFTDLNDPSATNIFSVETSSDECNQPHLSVEHVWSDHRLCCIYHNYTTGNVVIAQSTDFGETWSTVYTSPWTTNIWAIPKGAQGAASQSTDKFVFVARKSNNSLVILESISGLPGSWTETEYVHTSDIDNIDVAASHNYNQASVVVAFGYPWTATDYNVRILFRMANGMGFISKLVDGDALMTKTPVITCDGEYAGNNAGPDHYHLAYYKDHNGNTYYIPFALRCLNDSIALSNLYNTNPNNFERVGTSIIDTLTTSSDYGRPYTWYQMDMTTFWNNTHNQWFPAIVWMRYYPSNNEADPRLSFPDETFGILEHRPIKMADPDVHISPNPSRGDFILWGNLKNSGDIRALIYDASGRLLTEIIRETRPSGRYLFNNKITLPEGIYFIYIQTPDGATVKRLVIIK